MVGSVAPSRLERVRIGRLIAEEAALTQVEFVDCDITDLYVDDTTRFGETTPRIHKIHRKSEKGLVEDVFDPDGIAEWLDNHRLTTVAEDVVNEASVKLLDRVCRVMLRQHMIKDHQSDEFGRLLRNEYWSAVEAILVEAGLLERIKGKAMAGTYAPFVRMRDPYSLLANRSAPNIAAVWKRVGAIPR
jgi:hypothetical protein